MYLVETAERHALLYFIEDFVDELGRLAGYFEFCEEKETIVSETWNVFNAAHNMVAGKLSATLCVHRTFFHASRR